ncbi:MAG: hypothetical protein ACQEV7_15405 [Bacillota bacterium]
MAAPIFVRAVKEKEELIIDLNKKGTPALNRMFPFFYRKKYI